jgi:hypothetical protein
VVATGAPAGRRRLDVGAPVAEYWPEFKAAGRRTSGREPPDHRRCRKRPRDRERRDALQWDRTVDGGRPAPIPPYPHGYHALTYGYLVGEVLRRDRAVVGERDRHREVVDRSIEGMTIGAPGGAQTGGQLSRRGPTGEGERFIAAGPGLAPAAIGGS